MQIGWYKVLENKTVNGLDVMAASYPLCYKDNTIYVKLVEKGTREVTRYPIETTKILNSLGSDKIKLYDDAMKLLLVLDLRNRVHEVWEAAGL
jgi:hypothetical protein